MLNIVSVFSVFTVYFIAMRRIYKLILTLLASPLYVIDVGFVLLPSISSLSLATNMLLDLVSLLGVVSAIKFICFNKMPIKPSVTINDLKPQPNTPPAPSDNKPSWKERIKKFIKENQTDIVLITGVLTVAIIYLLYPFDKPGDGSAPNLSNNPQVGQPQVGQPQVGQPIVGQQVTTAQVRAQILVNVARIETLSANPSMKNFVTLLTAIQTIYLCQVGHDYIFRHLHEIFNARQGSDIYNTYLGFARLLLYPDELGKVAYNHAAYKFWADQNLILAGEPGGEHYVLHYKLRVAGWLAHLSGLSVFEISQLSSSQFSETIVKAIGKIYSSPYTKVAADKTVESIEQALAVCKE